MRRGVFFFTSGFADLPTKAKIIGVIIQKYFRTNLLEK